MQDLSQQDIRSIIGYFRNIKNIKIEGNTILYRNQTQGELLGLVIIGLGVLCCTVVKGTLAFLAIMVGILIIFAGIAFIMKFRSYAILNLTFKTIYTEYRLGDMVLKKCDERSLADIVAVGVDHKRKRPMRGGGGYEAEIFLRLFSADWVASKPTSKIDGCIETTNVSYITKSGEKRSFCEYSEKVNADSICAGFAEVIASIIGIKHCIAEETKGLVVNKIGNSYRFSTVSIKPTVIGAILDALKGVALIGGIGFIVVAILFAILG